MASGRGLSEVIEKFPRLSDLVDMTRLFWPFRDIRLRPMFLLAPSTILPEIVTTSPSEEVVESEQDKMTKILSPAIIQYCNVFIVPIYSLITYYTKSSTQRQDQNQFDSPQWRIFRLSLFFV